MRINPLPPQAFTKETLQKAYAWLLHQSASVKEMATTQDMLISLYLKAQRNGEASLETPSIQNFKTELKSLASMIDGLQTPVQTPVPTPSLAPSLPSSCSITTSSITTSTAASNISLAQLDLASLQILADVRQTLNLSSDTEALRALISLGYKQFKKLN